MLHTGLNNWFVQNRVNVPLQIYLTRRVLPCVWPKSVRKKTFPCSSLQTELSVQFLKIWVSNIERVKLDLAHQGCKSQLLDSHLRVLCSRWGIRHQLPACKHVLITEHIGIYVSGPITGSLIYMATLLFPQLFSVNSSDQQLPPVHAEHPQISHQILILAGCASETTPLAGVQTTMSLLLHINTSTELIIWLQNEGF